MSEEEGATGWTITSAWYFLFHETILSFGEPIGSLQIHLWNLQKKWGIFWMGIFWTNTSMEHSWFGVFSWGYVSFYTGTIETKSCIDFVAYSEHMGVSKHNGTPKSSILIGFSIINHPFLGTPIFGNIHMEFEKKTVSDSSNVKTVHWDLSILQDPILSLLCDEKMLILTNRTLETQFAMNWLPERKNTSQEQKCPCDGEKNREICDSRISFENCWDLKFVLVGIWIVE